MAPTNEILLEKLDRIEAMLLSQKKVLTFEEACIYTGRSRSDMYKKTAACEIPHYKPEGKMVYFDVEVLSLWCLRNPVKTKGQIEQEAATIVTLGKEKTANHMRTNGLNTFVSAGNRNEDSKSIEQIKNEYPAIFHFFQYGRAYRPITISFEQMKEVFKEFKKGGNSE